MDRTELANARRVVVKLGTAVVTHDGHGLALGRIHAIVEDIAALRQAGREIVLVSSGAVSMGVRQLGLAKRPASLGLRQACAAVGQGKLMALYSRAFEQLGVTTAQVLLTQEDLGDRGRALALRTTLMRLLEMDVVAILNENDSVSVRELLEFAPAEEPTQPAVFGDNDGLSARLATAIDADALVLLTDVDGVHSANPKLDPAAKRIAQLHAIDETTLALADGTSLGGTGGMQSKLEAARLAGASGVVTAIVHGSQPNVLRRCLEGDDVGTIVQPAARRRARRRHIALAERGGALVVNPGALEALRASKASLLPVGLIEVEGEFARGDVVEIRDESGRVHGRGVVNYDAEACRRLAGCQSAKIAEVLGYRGYDALVTRDNLVWGDV